MNDSLYIAATGMHMQQKEVDTISNNLANVNTPGYKKGRVSFEDLVYRDLAGAAGATEGARRLWQGSGVGISSILKSFIAGELKKTDAPMDVAVRGEGFFEVVALDGTAAYTRGGTLTIDKDGLLATATGQALKPSIHIGNDARGITIEPDGRVMVRTGASDEPFEAGRIELVRFADTSALEALGGNLYRPSERSGEPISGPAGGDGLGTIAQGFIEGSNVNLVEEMVDLMVAQRAYESSVKVIQASDEMLAMSNNLRK
ncbi:flagellar basal-body rod protein FlgG [Massilia sp. TSP1-1-2]|uniref:flagellar basal-body rod protein FlgG n=1 Tax=Massilia sp. TSP1-1-2 TaxID=2804649 RepID=UPI003CEDDB47